MVRGLLPSLSKEGCSLFDTKMQKIEGIVMRHFKYLIFLSFLLMGFLPVFGEEEVTIRLYYPDGQKMRYKNSYSIEYFSDRAELILMEPGSISIGFDGEWKSWETVKKFTPDTGVAFQDGEIGIVATIEKADSRALFAEGRLTYEQYPYTLDLLKGREFSWRILPNGQIHQFKPNFRLREVKREDLVTDIFQFWMPEFSPVLPEGVITVGDTWTGSRTFERNLESLDWMGKKSRMEFTSTYEIKKIKEKKGRKEITIKESRVLHYSGWFDINFISLYVDGPGKGIGEWVIDLKRGVVVQHKMRFDLDRPEVTKLGAQKPLDDIGAEVKISFSRKLEKFQNQKTKAQ